MALRKGKTKTNQETIDSEVQTVEKTSSVEDAAPFDTGTPADEEGHSAAEAPEVSKSVAVSRENGGAVVEHRPQTNVMSALAEDGFEGLELGFGSFPIIALKNEGVFEDTEGNEYDEEFDCIIQGTRTKYVIKNTRCDKKDETVVYSYDGKVDVNDNPLQDIIEEWAEEGWGHETKAYLEATAILVDENGTESDMVLLSIPKTSTKRLSGYIAQNKFRRQLLPNQYVTKCEVGEKITNVDFPFYPWKFTFVRPL